VFFSTRRADSCGKPVSVICFADFAKDFSSVLYVSEEVSLNPGARGCFDEHGVFPLNVVRVDNELWGYSCGWSRRKSVDVETAIGLTKSYDGGKTFHRVGTGPVLNASPKEPFLVGDAFVMRHNGGFHMWYIFGTNWAIHGKGGRPERTYKVGHATSHDGIAWAKSDEGRPILTDVLGVDECQALPCVLPHGGCFHMFFCFRESVDFRTNPTRSYRIGHAISNDLLSWSRNDDLSFSNGGHSWDASMMCYPGVCIVDEEIYLLYNGNEFGKEGFGAAILELC
jgi:hypothetical protein